MDVLTSLSEKLQDLKKSLSNGLPLNEVISKLRLIKAKLHTGSSDAFHFGFDRFKEAEGDAESIALKEEEKRKNNLALELAKWHRNPIWTDQPYELKVATSKGSFCNLDCSFVVGLPPDAVYDILCNPNNDSIFKNIKAVKSRKTLEDRGNFQRVLVEQTAIWHFLWLTGTFDVFMEVSTDKTLREINYRLAKGGFMKRFEGKWEIEQLPLLELTASDYSELTSPSEKIDDRVASQVTLRQRLQPAVRLPPPISGYVRGISASATRSMLADLQAEAKRIRSGIVEKPSHIEAELRTYPPPLVREEIIARRGDNTRKAKKRGSRFRQKIREYL